MKTIDVDPIPGDEPPHRRARPRRAGSPQTPPIPPATLASMLVVAAFVLVVAILAFSGRMGVTTISTDQIAVKLNYITGSRTLITTPGYKVYIPFIEGIFAFDRTPQKFVMEGDETRGDNHVPFLTVRAKDGSNFWFESLEIQYALIPGSVAKVADDSGVGDGFKRDWIRSYARSILRDEFGRYSAVEVANPSSYQSARIESTRRLNEVLRPHGIEVIDIITPKPRFDSAYEQAIEERKVADQEVEKLEEEKKRLLNERDRKLATVEKEMEVAFQELQGDLTRQRLEAEKQRIRITKSADAYAVERGAEGEGERQKMLAEAEGLRAKYEKEAEGLRAQAEALERRGSVVVREAIIQKLADISFTLLPYSRDPAPDRHEVTGIGASIEDGR